MIASSGLKNIYYGLRHGESEANVSGIIAAGEKARTDYGLTEVGRRQVEDAMTQAQDVYKLDQNTIIITSPLRRAYESAVSAANALGIPVEEIVVDERLRERSFGGFEGQSHSAYKDIIWPADKVGQEAVHNVETTEDVKKRVLELVETMEKTHGHKNILLVSHGDVLQILETWFENMSPREHRSLPHLQNAEIRKYN